MKQIITIAGRSFFLLLLLGVFTLAAAEKPKYVFLFIGDGMAAAQRTAAEAFSLSMGKGKLAINHFPYLAPTATCSISPVTDSAAAATALACGVKTRNGRIGMDVSGTKNLESIAYVARKNGKKVGILTSVTINHATPAGFYAHRTNRSLYYEIGLDLIASSFDYFVGGGFGKNDDKKSPLYKGDLYKLAKDAGYTVIVGDAKAFKALKKGAGKVIAAGGKRALPYAISGNKNVPSLADYTAKGIELLDNPNGFFMMVEGGSIDSFGHANDAGGNVLETIEFDKAVRVAVAFAEKHPEETLIVVTGDHETGGMDLGAPGSSAPLNAGILKHQKKAFVTLQWALKKEVAKDKNYDFEKCKAFMRKYLEFRFASDKLTRENEKFLPISREEEAKLLKAFLGEFGRETKTASADKKKVKKTNFITELRIFFNGKAGIRWNTAGHTARPVLTTSMGVGAKQFSGKLDNTEIAIKLKALMQK